MHTIQLIFYSILEGIPSFFINPVIYLAVILVLMQYRRQTLFERKLFSVRINNPWEQMFESLICGFGGGIVLTLLTVGLGIGIQPSTMVMVGLLSLILSCFQIQYLCTAYAAGILGLFSVLAKIWPQMGENYGLAWGWSLIQNVDVPSLLILVALLHLLEAFFVGKAAGRGSSPLLISGKRGLLLGAHQWQRFWFVPFFAVAAVPNSGGVFSLISGGWPFVSHVSAAGLSLVLLPAVIGFSDLSVSTLPRAKAKRSARCLVVYSVLLLGLSVGAIAYPVLGVTASLFAILGHDLMIRVSNWRERVKNPLFVPLDKGVRILAVIPKTPAAKLGIEPGEVLLRANGMEINRQGDLYPALQLHTTFCKIEVLNKQGNIKYLQCTLYQGEHHQLGLILSPDEQSEFYVDMKPVSIMQLIRQQIDRGA